MYSSFFYYIFTQFSIYFFVLFSHKIYEIRENKSWKKQLLSRLKILALTGTICTSVFSPSLKAYANERNFKNINTTYSNAITVDGITYSSEDIADSIRPNIDYSINYSEGIRERSAVTKAIKTAVKWLKGNWRVVYSRLPNWMKNILNSMPSLI